MRLKQWACTSWGGEQSIFQWKRVSEFPTVLVAITRQSAFSLCRKFTGHNSVSGWVRQETISEVKDKLDDQRLRWSHLQRSAKVHTHLNGDQSESGGHSERELGHARWHKFPGCWSSVKSWRGYRQRCVLVGSGRRNPAYKSCNT